MSIHQASSHPIPSPVISPPYPEGFNAQIASKTDPKNPPPNGRLLMEWCYTKIKKHHPEMDPVTIDAGIINHYLNINVFSIF